MLLSVLPLPFIFSSVWPFEYAVAIFFVLFILTFVFPSVNPSEYSRSMHLIILPGADIPPPIAPKIITFTELIFLERPFENRPIWPGKLPLPLLLPLYILPLIHRPVRPFFNPMTVLLVPNPVPLVTLPIRSRISPSPMSLSRNPVPNINISLRMDQPPISLALIIVPCSFINRPVSPDLDPKAVAETEPPLALVNRVKALEWPALWVLLHLVYVFLVEGFLGKGKVFLVVELPESIVGGLCGVDQFRHFTWRAILWKVLINRPVFNLLDRRWHFNYVHRGDAG